MVVYADVLIVLNLIVDYFLLRLSSKILNIAPNTLRIILSSVVGGIFSLYIFFPTTNILIELAIRLIMNTVMVLVCFGFKNLKNFLKAVGVFFTVTCVYAGVMIALWQVLKPNGMVINNSVVYFNISPMILIGTTVLGYITYLIFSKFFAGSATFAQKCEIIVSVAEKTVNATAIIDTGNSVNDVFGNAEVIIADRAVLLAVFENLDIEKNTQLRLRYRSVPCATVSGVDLLDGYRCDRVKIKYSEKVINVEKPIVAVSKTPLNDGYSAILNPKILNCTGGKDEKIEKITV